MTLPTVERVDGSYRVPVGGEKAIVPDEWTDQSIDSVYAPWEGAVKALFRAAAEVTAEGNTIHVRVESPERALIGHGVADDEADATARLAVLDHEDIVAFDGSDAWTVPAPDADSKVRALVCATVTELAADTLRSALDSIAVRDEELVEAEDDDAAVRLHEGVEAIDTLSDSLDRYHEELRRSIALETWDDGVTTDLVGELTGVLASVFRLDRSAERGTIDEVLERCDTTTEALDEIAQSDRSIEETTHEEFIDELDALADVSGEPLDVE